LCGSVPVNVTTGAVVFSLVGTFPGLRVSSRKTFNPDIDTV
jgi:hypothetical protein